MGQNKKIHCHINDNKKWKVIINTNCNTNFSLIKDINIHSDISLNKLLPHKRHHH